MIFVMAGNDRCMCLDFCHNNFPLSSFNLDARLPFDALTFLEVGLLLSTGRLQIENRCLLSCIISLYVLHAICIAPLWVCVISAGSGVPFVLPKWLINKVAKLNFKCQGTDGTVSQTHDFAGFIHSLARSISKLIKVLFINLWIKLMFCRPCVSHVL